MSHDLNSQGSIGNVVRRNSLCFSKSDDEYSDHASVEIMDLRPSDHPSVLMTAYSTISVSSFIDNSSVESDVSSVMFHTGINDFMNDISTSETPEHWDLAAARKCVSTPPSASTTNGSETIQGNATGRKRKRVAKIAVGIVALVLTAAVIFHLLTDSMFLFGRSGILGHLSRGSIEERVPEMDIPSRSIARIGSNHQFMGENLDPRSRLAQGQVKIYWKGKN